MKPSMCVWLIVVVVFFSRALHEARADTLLFAGAEIQLPDTGWDMRTGKMATLTNKDKRLLVEVYRFSQVPPADVAHLLKILKPRKNTTEVTVAKAEKFDQHGVAGTIADGTAKIGATPVAFSLTSVPVAGHAVVAVAFTPLGDKEKHRKELDGILKSLRSAANRANRAELESS